MVNLLSWTARGFQFEPLVPDTVVVEFVKQDDPERCLIHLVNFDLDRDAGAFEILCRGFAPRHAEAFTPDGDAPAVEIRTAEDDGSVSVRVEGFHRYLIVAIA